MGFFDRIKEGVKDIFGGDDKKSKPKETGKIITKPGTKETEKTKPAPKLDFGGGSGGGSSRSGGSSSRSSRSGGSSRSRGSSGGGKSSAQKELERYLKDVETGKIEPDLTKPKKSNKNVVVRSPPKSRTIKEQLQEERNNQKRLRGEVRAVEEPNNFLGKTERFFQSKRSELQTQKARGNVSPSTRLLGGVGAGLASSVFSTGRFITSFVGQPTKTT